MDDEMAMVCLRQFVERGLCAPPECVVCNLRPARQRRLCTPGRRSHGLLNPPVVEGVDGVVAPRRWLKVPYGTHRRRE